MARQSEFAYLDIRQIDHGTKVVPQLHGQMDSTDEICIRCASQTMFREIPQKRGYAGIPHFVDLVAPHDLYRKLVIQKSKQCISRFACLMIFFVENTQVFH
jgi:hypothetical protein